MASFLQSILGIQEPIFSAGLARLEKTTGNSGVDVRLLADIAEKAHSIMRRLGLDTRNTTGHELYFALNAAIRRKDGELLFMGADYVLLIIAGMPVSFNLIDVIENSHHEMPFGKNVISHGQRSLRGELVERYVNHARTNEATTYEIAYHIGLLPESDAWYNSSKYKYKQTGNDPKESAK